MAKITAEQLEIARGWQAFGERLGWKVVECDEGLAKFSRDHESSFFKIWLPERQDIERTWREQDKLEIKAVANG